MWKYIPGVKRPPNQSSSCLSKRRNSSISSSDDETDGDGRHFVRSWKDSHSWVKYDENTCKIFCSSANNTRKRTHLQPLDWLTLGVQHLQTIANRWSSVRASLESSAAAPVFSSAAETADKAILTLFKVAYFVAKEDVAILKFKALLERCHCPHLTRELYHNRDACHEMITILGDCLKLQLVELIHNTPFAGIMIDESTDLSVRKNLVVYINVLSKSGDVFCYFAHLAEMKQCDAEALTEAIIQYLNQRKIDISKLSGLGSDGASVMVGKHNGVGARMKCLNPFMLSNHCVAHKLALAGENSASSLPYFNQSCEDFIIITFILLLVTIPP